MLHEELSNEIIGAFYKVYNTLGFGFLEKVYEKAFCIELNKNGLIVKSQQPINVYYENEIIGNYFADIMINDGK